MIAVKAYNALAAIHVDLEPGHGVSEIVVERDATVKHVIKFGIQLLNLL